MKVEEAAGVFVLGLLGLVLFALGVAVGLLAGLAL
jgi:hypothetical protein